MDHEHGPLPTSKTGQTLFKTHFGGVESDYVVKKVIIEKIDFFFNNKNTKSWRYALKGAFWTYC
jgi:hypothetical protein